MVDGRSWRADLFSGRNGRNRMTFRPSLIGHLLAAFLLLLAACADAPPADTAAPAASGTTAVRHAEGFSLESHAGYQLLRVHPSGAAPRQVYALVPRGTHPAGVPAGATVIETPVRSLVVYSTTHLGPLLALGLEDRVVGVPDTAWVHAPGVRARARRGDVRAVGEQVDAETLVALRPDAIMISGSGTEGEVIERLAALGIPVVVNADWLEATPLGRAEWMVFVGALFGKAEEATAHFEAVARRYEALMARTQAVAERPAVLVGVPWRGTWYVPGGGSYMAHLLADAGAAYPWADDDATGALALDFEAVYAKAGSVDVWLNPGDFPSLAALAASHERLTLFEAWQRGAVYNNDRQRTPGGGFAYWERGTVEPDVVLADLIAIFHPRLLPGHDLVYFRQLPAEVPAS